MISYMSTVQMASLSLMYFENSILTFDLDPRSKVMAPNESADMISYMSIMQMESPSLMDFEIFAKIAF